MGGSLRRGVTDVHVHLQPFEQAHPATLEVMRQRVKGFGELLEKLKDPRHLLDYMDRSGVERACLISYPAATVLGLTPDLRELATYAATDPKRLLPMGSVDPLHTREPGAEVERLAGLGIRALKVHPPHQLYPANGYLDGSAPGLREIYATAERLRMPVMVHTGTSVFPGARIKYGDPIALDDVAQDFPDLTLIMAHGGRPLWCDTAFFLLRRHPRLLFDISGIPPSRLLSWFPRIEEIGDKVLFGSDWPGPDVPGMGEEVAAVAALPLSEEFKEKLFVSNARRVFPG